jgi:WD40 repeat protein/serine/threonine protein kinase
MENPEPGRSDDCAPPLSEWDNQESGSAEHPRDAIDAIESACDRFEAELKLGRFPSVDDYVTRVAESARPVLAHELSLLVAIYRRAEIPSAQPAGSATTIGVAAPGTSPSRPPNGSTGPPSSVRSSALHLRCPHCHSLIHLGDKRPSEVLCPTCGSAFLVEDTRETLTTAPAQPVGKFELLERVGLGACGAVWRARDTALGRIVALKIPNESLLGSSSDERERFAREARAVAGLRHPGIVPVYEVTAIGSLPVIVSEFVAGVTLRDLLESRQLSFREAATLIAEVADSLEYAHSMGAIHRDVKPANIMIEPSPEGALPDRAGRPRLLDFGLALREDVEARITIDGQPIGTPAYMSPEQAGGRLLRGGGGRADVYSLGVVLYELLCGELPFRGTKAMVVYQLLHEEPRPPRRVNHKIPRDLETVCLKAMAKEPSRRYATARQMGDDLRRFLRGEPIVARQVGRMERLWLWSWRNPALAAASASAAIAALAALGLAMSFAVYQTHAAGELSAALHEATRASEERYAIVALEQGAAECERGDVGAGLVVMADALTHASQAGASSLERVARTNIAIWRRSLCPLRALLEHAGRVRTAGFSRDGRTLMSASSDGTIRLWDASTGAARGDPLTHGSPVRCAALSPDGSVVAGGGEDGTVRFWQVSTGKTLTAPFHHDDEVSALVFSPDGQRAASASEDKTARLFDGQTGQPIGQPLRHTKPVWALAFSADSQTLATGGEDGLVMLWNARDGTAGHRPLKHENPVWAVSFSHDGRRAITGCTRGEARLWDMASGTAIRLQLKHSHKVGSVSFRSDDRFALTAGGAHGATIVSVPDGERVGDKLSLDAPGDVAAFSPDGRLVLTGCRDSRARLWDAATNKLVCALQGQGEIKVAAFSPDGRHLVTAGSDYFARLWETASDEIRQATPRDPGQKRWYSASAISPDGSCVATGEVNGRVQFRDTEAGSVVRESRCHAESISAIAFSPDGKTVFTAADREPLRRWNAETLASAGKDLPLPRPKTDDVGAMAVSPDGHTLLVGTFGGFILAWDLVTGQLKSQHKSHTGPVWSLAFSPDGALYASASNDQSARLWSAATHQAIGPPLLHQSEVRSIAFSPDGTQVLTGSTDRSARLWQVSTGQPSGLPLHCLSGVNLVAFAPDGLVLLTGAIDGRAVLWDEPTRKSLGLLPPFAEPERILCAQFRDRGRRVVIAAEDGSIRRWILPQPIDGGIGEIVARVQIDTGLRLDQAGGVQLIEADQWRRLAQLGERPSRGRDR